MPSDRLVIGRCYFCQNSIWSDEWYFEDEDEQFTCKGCFEPSSQDDEPDDEPEGWSLDYE